MSLRNTARAFPTLLRIGFAEAVAYRAEMLVWVLATTMPLIMLVFWTAVAADAPMGRLGAPQFVAYFLATFIVRQLTGSWVAWQLNFEVRQGTLAMRLLRPIHPAFGYAAENLAALPLRLIVAIPIAVIALATVGASQLPRDPVIWGAWCLAMLGGWMITFLSNLLIGVLAFFMESSQKVMDAWLAIFFVLSGYLIPVELFPSWIRSANDWLPFRYQIGLPVELMTNAHSRGDGLLLLARQWGFVAVMTLACMWLWRAGLRRFAAYGG